MKNLYALNSQLNMAKLLIDHSPIAYIILDRDYRCVYMNESFALLRKLNMADVIGNRCYNISNGGTPCEHCAVLKAFETGEKNVLLRRDVLPDGTIKFIEDYAIPLQKNSQGEIEYILEMMVNRTEEMKILERTEEDYEHILSLFSSLLESKDPYTATHSKNVRKISLHLAQKLRLPQEEIFDIAVAANLHDIGKIGIPYAIINKPGKLSDAEFALIKTHPKKSYDFLTGLLSFDRIKNIVKSHHERVDGLGYPEGLCQDQIPLGAKIIAVADTYDAITSNRSYRKASSHEEAAAEINRVRNKQLDAQVVDAFLTLSPEILAQDADLTLKSNKFSPIQRSLQKGMIKENPPALFEEKYANIDKKSLIHAILAHSPCGYILVDKHFHLIYINQYFMDYLNVDQKEDASSAFLEMYHQGKFGVIPLSFETKKPQKRQETFVFSKDKKTLDIFSVPLFENGSISHFILIAMDRSEEIVQRKKRQSDFQKLANDLSHLYYNQIDDGTEDDFSETIIAAKKKLARLLAEV